jgi:protocatechuate 3,4-dioxygenase beta subunit
VGREQTRTPRWRRGRILARREALAGLTAFGAVALTNGLRAQQAGSCMLTPNAGEGPFYFDPELVRTDIADGRPGAPLELAMQVVRIGDCAALTDARVDVWHSDALGLYSGYGRQPGTGEPAESVLEQAFLRGTQFTDAEGRVRFRTIYPSWYRGRTPHVHFKVLVGNDEVVASQVFFPDEVNARVFEGFEPYRSWRARRDTFNANDSLRDEGVYCSVDERANALFADLVVGIRA